MQIFTRICIICKSFYQNILNRSHLSDLNGSVQWEMSWIEKVANFSISIGFRPWWPRFISSMYFRFRKITRRFLGPLDNVRRFVQCASHLKKFFYKNMALPVFYGNLMGIKRWHMIGFGLGPRRSKLFCLLIGPLILCGSNLYFCIVKQNKYCRWFQEQYSRTCAFFLLVMHQFDWRTESSCANRQHGELKNLREKQWSVVAIKWGPFFLTEVVLLRKYIGAAIITINSVVPPLPALLNSDCSVLRSSLLFGSFPAFRPFRLFFDH